MLLCALRQLGLLRDARETKIFTTQSQHPGELVSRGGIGVEIFERDCAHKWLGCMISRHTQIAATDLISNTTSQLHQGPFTQTNRFM